MKVLALISGGKDSIFNMIKCIENGHTIIALGNLFNQGLLQSNLEDGVESNSYMYQTVGSNMSIAIAECLQKPIIRRKIVGKPKIKSLQYQGDKQGDEVEDLFQLIKQAVSKFPQINAVSSGAIFLPTKSLECKMCNVMVIIRCLRFNMTSLAYLWQRQQSMLLKEMIDYPLNAIIIKIASYGLKKVHLGKFLSQLYDTFMKLKDECQMNVCGEGGQYQSLVLDCALFKKKIVIDNYEIIELDKNQIGPVAYMKIINYHLQIK